MFPQIVVQPLYIYFMKMKNCKKWKGYRFSVLKVFCRRIKYIINGNFKQKQDIVTKINNGDKTIKPLL